MSNSPSNATILVVEDEVILGEYVNAFLSDLGYDVLPLATSGEQAVESAIAYRPDLILMDIVLRGEMDGIDAVRHIKARHQIPVIYLTAHCADDAMARIKVTEPHGLVTKPFQEQELVAAIEIALYKASAEEGLRACQRRYRSLLDNATLGLLSVNRDGMIEDVNDRLLQILSTGDLGNGIRTNVKASKPLVDSGLSGTINECLETGQSMTGEYRYNAADGRASRLRCLFQPVLDELGAVSGVQVIVEQADQEQPEAGTTDTLLPADSRQNAYEMANQYDRMMEKITLCAELAQNSANDPDLVRQSMEQILQTVKNAGEFKRNLQLLLEPGQESTE